ncbi:MAG: exonuclease SbcCD subunit D [Oscillibacter sp.]|nr:exonuclease SbcCD subunit D [Oscillibacter sp.]
MKYVHLSDLHLGKRVNEFSMLEDQKYILDQILHVIDGEMPDGVILAGDIYDKAIPPAEAVELFDDFLFSLSKRKLQTFVISGNHDSPERIAFGGRLMEGSGVHLSPVYDGQVKPILMRDEWGDVAVYLLPFVKPAHVRRYFPEKAIESYTDAMASAIEAMDVDTAKRNLLVTHQFVTGAVRSDSEHVSVGGADNVDVSVFQPFDYVALGHIHGPQKMSRETVRYCGTPLKYSFSEVSHKKSVTVVELREKGNVTVRTVALKARRDLRELRGTYMELTDRRNYAGTAVEDYLHITLTDEEDVPDAVGKLRTVYPNLMKLSYDNARTRRSGALGGIERMEQKSPLDLFAELYDKQNNRPMSEEQRQFAQKLIEKIWEEEE